MFWLHRVRKLGFLQEEGLTWCIVSIRKHPYSYYLLSIATMASLCRFELAGSELLDIELEVTRLID